MGNVPAGARKGQKMAVPIPKKGETVESVCEKQQAMTTSGATTAKGLAIVGAVGAGVVGGALLGDHLAGGTMAVDGADWVEGAAGDVADWVEDWAPDAADAAG